MVARSGGGGGRHVRDTPNLLRVACCCRFTMAPYSKRIITCSHCNGWTGRADHIKESVVESQGNCIDKHADPRRGLSWANYVMEAFIDWNVPVSHKCGNFIRASLNRKFESMGHDHFVADSLSKFMRSKVLDKLHAKTSKLSFLE